MEGQTRTPIAKRGQRRGNASTPRPNTQGAHAVTTEPLGRPHRRLDFVTVHYTHGGPVPPIVADTIAAAVARALALDPNAGAGVVQQTDTAGQFSRTRQFAAWAIGGQALLSPDDITLARSFRTVRPTMWALSTR